MCRPPQEPSFWTICSATVPVSLNGSDGVQVHDAAEALAWEHLQQADVLLTAPRSGWRNAPAHKPAGWPGRLRWVHLASVGVDFFPRWLFEDVQVTCARGVASEPIADYVLSALLEQSLGLSARVVHEAQDWPREFSRAFTQPGRLLGSQTLGIVGYGAIGQAVARRAKAFGMQVLTLRRSSADGITHEADGTRRVQSLQALLSASDHVLLAAPLTDATRGLINAQTLAHSKPGLHLVNVARGALVDQEALREALDSGLLAAASLDVTTPEPLPQGHWLYRHPKVRLTPHISWAAGDVQAATRAKFLDNLQRYRAGQPERLGWRAGARCRRGPGLGASAASRCVADGTAQWLAQCAGAQTCGLARTAALGASGIGGGGLLSALAV